MTNDDSQTMSLKKTFLDRCSDLFSSRKLLILATALFFPWKLLWNFRVDLEKLRRENALLSKEVSTLRCSNEKLILNNDHTWRIPADQISGILNWPELLVESQRTNNFVELLRIFRIFSNENMVSNPSFCWTLLASKNCDQLLTDGYNNFKRTIGHNYFNFLVQKGDSQIHAAESLFPASIIEHCHNAALATPNDPNFNTKEQFSYYYFVFLLWEYVKKIDLHHYLKVLEEPKEGNPILVTQQGKSMSQDLANSLIEYYSMMEHVSFNKVKNILEIGGGYGRNAFVMLKLNPHAKIVLVDIWPALFIAQRYLASVFNQHKIFKVNNFSCYAKVKDEIENSKIVFLLPHQLALLPDNYFNLCLNISSFGEMKADQIEWYFEQINRLTRGHFYTKQWNISKNPFDGLVIHKKDYPYPVHWKEIYSRNCVIQTEFFESLYQVN